MNLESPRASAHAIDARCLLVGEESLVVQCAVMLRTAGVPVVGVASAAADVRSMAASEGFETVDTGETSLAAAIGASEASVLISAAHLEMIPGDALDAVDVAVNFHDGPLPTYAGLNVTTWAIHNGESSHAVNWHLMDRTADTGAILATESFEITADDTAFTLNARCYEYGVQAFESVVAMLAAGEVTTTAQPAGERRQYLRAERPFLVLDPAADAAEQVRTARALDLGDRIANGVGGPRLMFGDTAYAVAVSLAPGDDTPGRVLAADRSLRIAASGGALDISDIRVLPSGDRLQPADLLARHGLTMGGQWPSPPASADAAADADRGVAAAERGWAARLADFEPAEPALLDGAPLGSATVTIDTQGRTKSDVLAGITAWLAATSPDGSIGFSITDPSIRERLAAAGPLLMAPVVVAADGVDTALAAGPIASDLTVRIPSLRGRVVNAPVRVDLDGGSDAEAALRITVRDGETTVAGAFDDTTGRRIAAGLGAAIADPAAAGTRTEVDDALLTELNDVVVEVAHGRTIDGLFRARAEAQPDAPAVSAGGETTTYAQLADRIDRLAAALADAGVGHGDLVGIALRRSIDMVAATLAVMRRGAAYVPLDPTYPADRVLMMVEDAAMAVVVVEHDSVLDLSGHDVALVHPTDLPDVAGELVAHDGDDLAYVIYTSGSTGRPKGVQLEHHNVANFFDAMDEVVDPDPSGVWLAVTSLSFDISVLELLWTLTRGLHVVVKSQSGFGAAPAAVGPRKAASFSLMYFGAGEAIADNGYEFVRESATWADRNGFEACWFPERHFHDFGAPYPNPSVIGSAVAALTEQIQIRAGSVVLPLHNPVRVAEEWAVVDNLSQGRVGLSFAPGWQINDFVLNPGAWETARQDLAKNMDIVRALWRGETIDLPGPRGDVPTHTYPRPVQDDLEMWLTSAGSRGSFEAAGRMGVNVLTHLLGQSLDDLRGNIDAYRAARKDAGHEGDGHVTVMVHTYLAEDGDESRQTAREPLKGYLGTAAGLLKNIASEFPTFRGSGEDADEAFRNLTDEEMGQLLDLAADRYLGTAGLFGTVDDGVEMATALTNVGADEIACLIDFGVAAPQALGALDLIAQVRDGIAVAAEAAPSVMDETVAALVDQYGVSHFQCTPSLAEMILAEPADKAALGTVGHMLVGGEALPTSLATELRVLLSGRLTNMYGPTETTIWSLCHEVDAVPSGSVPIGRPIRNNPIAILDPAGREVAVGVWGELFIGGEGVARGYKDRPELTAERFVERDGERIYATGDRARVHPLGFVEFGGRGDGQVKIRGHRIELGEIESVLDGHASVARSVVATPPDQPSTLVAFVTGDGAVDPDELIAHVAANLPEAMVPAAVSVLDALPLTPNGKVDRKALPFGSIGGGSSEAPTDLDGNEAIVAEVWNTVLGRTPGLDDNFFDVGGHSLRAVAVFRQLADRIEAPIALTDVFRFPTMRSFAAHLDGASGDVATDDREPVAAAAGTDRGAKRRAARQRRGGRA